MSHRKPACSCVDCRGERDWQSPSPWTFRGDAEGRDPYTVYSGAGHAIARARHRKDAAMCAAAPELTDAFRALMTEAGRVHADWAQEAIGDPCGSADRLPYVRIHENALKGLVDALASARAALSRAGVSEGE